MEKFTVINIELYPFDVIVSIGQTNDELYEDISGNLTKKQFLKIFKNQSSPALTAYKKGQPLIIRFLKEETFNNVGIIAHEAFHAVSYILSNIGIPFSLDTEEAYTYLLQYLVNEIVKIKEIKKCL